MTPEEIKDMLDKVVAEQLNISISITSGETPALLRGLQLYHWYNDYYIAMHCDAQCMIRFPLKAVVYVTRYNNHVSIIIGGLT